MSTPVTSIQELLQCLANGIASGFAYGLIATGFSLVFATCRFFHFAHGGMCLCAAYVAYAAVGLCGLFPAALMGITAAGLLGGITELAIYRTLRRRSASPLTLLLASLGIYVMLQNGVSLIFGDETQLLRSGEITEAHDFLGVRLSSIQLGTMCASILICGATWVFLTQTRTGRLIRAVASNPKLAVIVGVRQNVIVLLVMVLGCAMAGFSGIFMGLETDLTPSMGFRAVLMGVVAMIVGGVGSVPGSMLGGVIVGLAQHLPGAVMPSKWQDVFIFGILVLFLVVRPQGLFGRRTVMV